MKNQRISFEQLQSTLNSEGITTKEWVEVRNAWASVTHRSGAQKWADGGYTETVTDLFTIRYVPGWQPTSSLRLVWNGRAYDIESVDDIREEHQDVEIRAVYIGSAKGA